MKVVYKDPIVTPRTRYLHEVYMKRIPIEFQVIGGKSSGLSDLARNNTREDPLIIDLKPS